MAAWAGLGYYSRARNLLACARAVVDRHQSVFPEDEAALLGLPGIGGYTAAAIAAIAYRQPAPVVARHVARVIAPLLQVDEPKPKAKTRTKQRGGAAHPFSPP